MKTIIWIWSTWYGARTARTGTNTQIKNGDVAAASIGMMTYSIDFTSRQIMMTIAVMGRDEMDELNEKIKRVFADLNIRCAYNMPSFWADGGKDYVVIPTRYAKGYQKALEDAEREITEVLSEQPEYTEQDMREQFNAGYACGMHAAQPESKREWYMKGYRDAQANIVQCEDCKWRRNQNGTMAWIPCRALVTPDDFYCKYAERKEQ